MTRAGDVVFARTRHVYDSYTDFWRLVELAEFPTCYVDEIDFAAHRTYIVSPANGEFPKQTQRACKIVWWNLERPDVPGGIDALRMSLDASAEHIDAVWVSDRHFASCDARLKYVTLGSNPWLAPDFRRGPFRYDFVHLSYVTNRRRAVYQQLMDSGLTAAPNGWGEARHQVLQSSRVILSIRQHDVPLPIGEPLRFALAAAYQLPLLTEPLADAGPLVRDRDFLEITPETAVSVVHEAVERDSERERLGANLHVRLCWEHPFKSNVMRACEAMR